MMTIKPEVLDVTSLLPYSKHVYPCGRRCCGGVAADIVVAAYFFGKPMPTLTLLLNFSIIFSLFSPKNRQNGVLKGLLSTPIGILSPTWLSAERNLANLRKD